MEDILGVRIFERHARGAGRSRPLCDYPKWLRYNGSGDVNQASSFTCVN
jgi:Tannase and feruloyl esterase